MKALFIGGTGIISTACSALALEKGWDLTLLNRGQHRNDVPAGAKSLVLDINDTAAVKEAMEGQYYDVIADWVLYKPEDADRDVELFLGHCGQFIATSSCAAYERPMRDPVVTESTCLNNRFSQYGQNKREIEERLFRAYREKEFPVTVVRPSLTYGDTQTAYALGSWAHPWAIIDRILKGKEILVHGDGTNIWPMTHNTDFAKGYVGLMGNEKAIGEAFHITSEELLTWDDIIKLTAKACGVKDPKLVHVSAYQIDRFMPGQLSNLIGDKSSSTIMDNSKIRHYVPGFECTVSFEQGIRRTVDYLKAHPELQTLDPKWEAQIDEIIEADKQFYPKR